MEEREKLFFRKTERFGLLLSLLVILIHAVNLAGSAQELAELSQSAPPLSPVSIEQFFSGELGQTAVPAFFILSGYLFYRKLQSFSGIFDKWRRRFRSLVIPYGAWNTLLYLLYALIGRAPISLRALSDAAVNYRYEPVFWYLYQLILLTALAPLFFLFLRKRLLSCLILLLPLFLIFRGIDLPLFNEDALFYYLLGGALSRNLPSLFEGEERGRQRIFAAFLLLFAVVLRILIRRSGEAGSLSEILLFTVLFRAALPLSLWFFLPSPGEGGAEHRGLGFFLYAFHYPAARLYAALIRRLGISGDWILLLLFFLLPPLCLLLAMALTRFLRRRLPRVWEIFSGGR